MKTIDQWLGEYGESHTHPINKLIHWCAVPTIYLSVFGLLWDIPRLEWFAAPWVNWATLITIPVMVFYFRLSVVVGMAMVVFTVLVALLIHMFDQLQVMPVALFSLILFAIMWVFQFIGHHIEGKKPSFFKDLQFLLIGPLWLMVFLLRRLNIRC